MKVATLVAAGFALLIGLPAAASAQSIPPGTWTGTVKPPDNEAMPVTYEVVTKNDSLAITIHQEQMGAFPVRDIHVLADRITFSWTPGGTDVKCVLMKKQDRSYAGDCTDGEGGTGQLVMIPPK